MLISSDKDGPIRRVAYLANHYPAISHTFIRREIQAVEQNDRIRVARYSLAKAVDPVIDPSDVAEAARTCTILKLGAPKLLWAAFAIAISSPLKFVRALSLALAIGWRSDRGLARTMAYLVEACSLYSLLAEEGVEHVHAHFGTNATAVAMLCHELGGPAYSFTMHGPLEFERAPLLSLTKKVDRAKFVVAISDYCRAQTWRSCAPKDRGKVHVIGCGVAASFASCEPSAIPFGRKLVFVGRLSRLKAPDLLLEALGRLDAENLDFELVIAGDGDLRATIEELIETYELREKVLILGYCDEATVRQHIIDSRALVLPSFSEGLPVVLMEALALGRPVVSTYVAGIPELVEHGKSGWLVPAGSVDALTSALREVLMAPPEQLAAMGRAGREKVLMKHNADVNGQALAKLFLEACQ